MGMFLPGKRTQHRRFDYQPRFYDPARDQKIRERIRIQRLATSRRRSPLGLVYALILLLFAIFIYNSLA